MEKKGGLQSGIPFILKAARSIYINSQFSWFSLTLNVSIRRLKKFKRQYDRTGFNIEILLYSYFSYLYRNFIFVTYCFVIATVSSRCYKTRNFLQSQTAKAVEEYIYCGRKNILKKLRPKTF